MFELFLLRVVRFVYFVFLCQLRNDFSRCGFYSRAAAIQENMVFVLWYLLV